MAIVRREDVRLTEVGEGRQRYLIHTDHLMAVVLEIEGAPPDEPDPPHAHPHEQITYVAAGAVRFFIDGAPVTLGPGDLITVPPDAPHCIQPLTESVRLVDMFTPLREDFLEEHI